MPRELIWSGNIRRQPAAAADLGRAEAAASPDGLAAWMCQWVAGKLRLPADQVTADSAFEDLGLDSLVAVELSGQLESILGREVPASVAWEHRTLGELASAVFSPAGVAYGDMDRAVV
jgi:acyl carrier protein